MLEWAGGIMRTNFIRSGTPYEVKDVLTDQQQKDLKNGKKVRSFWEIKAIDKGTIDEEPYYRVYHKNNQTGKEFIGYLNTSLVNPETYSFDTGGYTGEWGAEGRMAMLHEKEIVLNKQDTANILNAVSIVRGIGDLINNLSTNLLGSLSQRTIDSTLGMRDFEQNVHITAEFPNVSSSSEIEDALRNLTNVAAQRAFNTRI